jgi:hypothetical protein
VFVDVLYINRPVAGEGIVFRYAALMRGIKIPSVVMFTSSTADGLGIIPVLLMPTPWEKELKVCKVIKVKVRRKRKKANELNR